ncbi:hypothetical protein JY651_46175 [Pyxidicoccus parkwayensis]|uniref:Uncharacterized protein n=1 Tax=Pyxidicoccus parkwayensis TaxID=2813578 RepID=A0ABX7NYF6_9BACT|nr:hypothetical protein [Pyxidicoccus parkwaysis]QSQ22429.1 hypothetical protein JY651_46175 [Pyxidicoccus parkwaysis]
MEHLTRFLTELTTDPFKHLAFQQDPEGTAREAGLEPWTRYALEQGAGVGNWQKCVFGLDPGPDPLEDPS